MPTQNPVAAVKVDSTYERRRKALESQIKAAQKAFERESRTGFQNKTKNAARFLKSLNKQLEDLDREQRDNAPWRQRTELGLTAAAPVVGYAFGSHLAKKIDSKVPAGIKARNAELNKLAKQAEALIPDEPGAPKAPRVPKMKLGKNGKPLKNQPPGVKIGKNGKQIMPKPAAPKPVKISPTAAKKLGAIVKTADNLKLGPGRMARFTPRGLSGPIGLATGAALIAEGTFARVVLADQAADKTVKAGFKALGTASAFAATGLVAKRIVSNATTSTMLNAKSLAVIEQARALSQGTAAGASKAAAIKGGSKAVAKAAPMLARLAGAGRVAGAIGSKIAAPITVAAFVGGAAYSYYKHGDATRALGAGVDAALFGLTDFEGKIAKYNAQQNAPKPVKQKIKSPIPPPVAKPGRLKKSASLKTGVNAASARPGKIASAYTGNVNAVKRSRVKAAAPAKVANMSTTFVQGHYATQSKTGKKNWVRGHVRHLT